MSAIIRLCVGMKHRACVAWETPVVNYQPLKTLLQAQSPILRSRPLIPSRTGLADMASPLRARDSLIHLPFLTLQGGKEMEKAARNTLATAVWRHKMKIEKFSLILLRHTRWIVEMNVSSPSSQPVRLFCLHWKKKIANTKSILG